MGVVVYWNNDDTVEYALLQCIMVLNEGTIGEEGGLVSVVGWMGGGSQ